MAMNRWLLQGYPPVYEPTTQWRAAPEAAAKDGGSTGQKWGSMKPPCFTMFEVQKLV